MPVGNHHYTPSGIWYEPPSTQKLGPLLLRSFRNLGLVALSLICIQQYRSLSWKYTYTSFIGKTMTLGKISVMDHEPLSVEEIDKLKAEEKRRKNKQ